MASQQITEQHENAGQPRQAASALVLLVLALLSFFTYPGHTFLESDSQIFMPVLLHMQDPWLYRSDVVLEGPHTAYTLWDELVRGLNYATGVRHELLLSGLQIVFRFIGLLGVFWMLGGLGLEAEFALIGAAVYGLGAWVFGPTVLTVEYEPVPRAFALALVLLALGFVGRRRYRAAGIAGSLAFLLHAPTSAAFWLVYLVCLAAGPRSQVPSPKSQAPSRRSTWDLGLGTWDQAKALAPLAAAVVLLLFSAWFETGKHESMSFFSRIDPAWEKLQRLRAPYVWPSMLLHSCFWLYGCLAAVIAVAVRVVPSPKSQVPSSKPGRRSTLDLGPGTWDFSLGPYLWLLPAIGLVSIPLTWLLLEKLKWAMMPLFQPMRYLLYVVLFGILLSYAAAIVVMRERGRYLEGVLWLLLAFLIAFQPSHILWLAPLLLGIHISGRLGAGPGLAGMGVAIVVIVLKPFGLVFWSTPNLKAAAVSLGFALLIAVGARAFPAVQPQAGAVGARQFLAVALAGLLAAVLFLAAPLSGHRTSLGLPTPELLEVSAWAREQTPRDAVFLFPDAGRGLDPGVFRYYARRAVYVDWKTGGQVNYFRGFGESWWERWQATMAEPFRPDSFATYRRLGIRYLVLRKPPNWLNGPFIYHNARYSVVAVPAS